MYARCDSRRALFRVVFVVDEKVGAAAVFTTSKDACGSSAPLPCAQVFVRQGLRGQGVEKAGQMRCNLGVWREGLIPATQRSNAGAICVVASP